jgi:hypothetical protein
LLFVSDAGRTVIWTGRNQIICVSREGTDRGTIKLLEDAFSEAEYKDYVHETTAGPMWAGYSLWYFLEVDGKDLFVIRPWWGRRIFIDVDSAFLARASEAARRAVAAYERNYVISELAKGVRTRAESEKDGGQGVWHILEAAYLAGVLQISDAIPDLAKLQDSTFSGSSTSGGMSALEEFDGEVDPHSYSTFRLRQVVHLSLRRLGKTPGPWPIHEFEKRYEDHTRDSKYRPKPLAVPRNARSDAIRNGMKAEAVLDLIGAPDFIGHDTWEYDVDSTPASSLVLKWDARRVTRIERRSPALWKQGLVRDRQIAE